MASMGITIAYERRSAEFRPAWSGHGAKEAEPGDVFPVKVHGAFQYTEEGGDAYPMFLIEFMDGICELVGINYIKFIKEEDEC